MRLIGRKSNRSGWWGGLLAHFVNSQSITTYLPPLLLFRPMSLNGMFYVLEAAKLRSIGGFAPILNGLCDDYALHRHVTANRWTVTQGVTFQRVSTSIDSFAEYWRMMHRWMVFGILLARDQSIQRQAYLVMMLALPPFLLLVAIPLAMLHWLSAVAFLLVIVMRHCLLIALRRFAGAPSDRFGFVASLLAELLQPFQTLSALLNSSIVWRGRRIRLHKGLRFESAEPRS
ncbi:MAG: glycosyltransferase [Planctomycetota bacterium]